MYYMHLFLKDLEEMEDYVPFYHLFLKKMKQCSTKQQLGAKYLSGDTYLIPNTIYGF